MTMENSSETLNRSSRLIVKNLPNSASVDKLRTLFASKGDVTDVQLKYTADGRFRNFGFVGFKSEEQAETAYNYFNNTYIGATKIKVEKCAALGDPNKPRAWSKYAPEKLENEKNKRKKEKKSEEEVVVTKKKKEEEILEKCKEDADFLEFLQSHKKSNAWANDDVLEELEKSVSQLKKKKKKKEGEIKDEEEKAEIEKEPDLKKSKGEKGKKEKVLPENEYFTVKLRDLPKKARKKDIKLFFGSIHLQSIRIPPKIRGIAYVGFKTEKERMKALSKNKSIMLGKKIAVYKYESNQNLEDSKEPKSKWALQQEALEKETETVGESGRIFLRNLPYSATEDDIRLLFEKFGPVTEVNLPLDRLTRQIKGIGFVSFMLPEHASNAFTTLDGTTFQGRMLHLLPAKSKEEDTDDVNAGSTYKTTQELKKKKTAAQSLNWNTLFLGQNAISEVVSSKYGVSREAFLLDNNDEKDSYQVSTAVRMALAETEVVADTKTFLEQNGVSLEAFEVKGKKPERSRTVLLVRNLVADTPIDELTNLFAKYGELGRIVMPPSGITAIVEFLEPAEARRAFTKLAYTKFRQMPMYLEWAPVNAFKSPPKKSDKIKQDTTPEENKAPVSQEIKAEETESAELKETKAEKSKRKKLKERVKQADINITENEEEHKVQVAETSEGIPDDMIAEPDTTIFVKSLNFTTDTTKLKEHFKECGPIFSANVAQKRDPKQPGKMLSMGYGFVQYYRAKDASNAIKNLQGSVLQNHTLELKKSNRTLEISTADVRKDSTKEEKESTKILIRNIPFQATRKEVTDLFKTFGQIKAVRLPTKMDGSGEHRGFCFVEFQTTKDASFAFSTLSKSTHLYGRRLVLEWAAADETVEELRAKTAKKYNLQTGGERLARPTKTKQMMRYFDTQAPKANKDNDEGNEDNSE